MVNANYVHQKKLAGLNVTHVLKIMKVGVVQLVILRSF